MTEQEAKERLKTMLVHFTPGSVLHLLAEVFHDQADQVGDPLLAVRYRQVEITLIVVGLGIDAACPR